MGTEIGIISGVGCWTPSRGMRQAASDSSVVAGSS